MTSDGQFELTDFLHEQMKSRQVMNLTEWINSHGKAQYVQIREVVTDIYNACKDGDDVIERITNAVSIYVLEKSGGYMKYLFDKSK